MLLKLEQVHLLMLQKLPVLNKFLVTFFDMATQFIAISCLISTPSQYLKLNLPQSLMIIEIIY